MTSQTAIGWILDVRKDYASNDIVIFIKLVNDKVISFKQKLGERTFYILPKSHSAGEDLLQQLSRQDQLIEQICWDEKFIDLHDKNKTQLVRNSLANSQKSDRQDVKTLFQKLHCDSRVKALYNIDLSDVMEFIYTKLKISPASKVKIESDGDRLLSIERIEDNDEIAPPFSTMFIQASNENIGTNEGEGKKEQQKLIVRANSKSAATTLEANSLSDPILISYITKIDPDIIIFCDTGAPIYSQNGTFFKEWSKHKAIIHSRNPMEEIELLELVEKAKFGYLPLRLASKYGMMRLIDSRLTYELIQRDFVIPSRMKTISKHHEQIRTLQDIVEMDKAGMLISPEIGIHENVAVLDFNDQYANLIMNHKLSYETNSQNQLAILPSIVNELVQRRIHLKRLLKTNTNIENQSYFRIRLETLKQILVCLYGTSGSIWNRYSNVKVFEEINKLSRQILLKTKDIAQDAGFELIYADTDAVFLKKKDATKQDFQEILSKIAKETGLDLTLEFHYKYLVLLHVEADEKLEAKKHYYGLTYGNQLVTRGIDTRRHDSPVFIKQFQMTLLSKLFDYNDLKEVLTVGYENALLYIAQSIDKLMNGEVQITDLVISKLLRQNIEKYRSLFPHIVAAIKLNVSGVIASRGDNIQYVYTDSNHSNPLNRIVPAKLISSENYDRENILKCF